KQFAAFLKRSPATSKGIRRFQLHLAESGASICNRNRIMTGLRFLCRVTLRRLDLAAEGAEGTGIARMVQAVLQSLINIAVFAFVMAGFLTALVLVAEIPTHPSPLAVSR